MNKYFLYARKSTDEPDRQILSIEAQIKKAAVAARRKKESNNVDIDIRNYAKYLLKEGTLIEKRELLSFLKSKLILKNKKILLQ